jgi:hypothetical protein
VKKKVKKPTKAPKEAPKLPANESVEKKNPFDFGGLPQRDLKKNLGCG